MTQPYKPGYYVENRYFGFNIGQANARAKWLHREYGRPVAVRYLDSLKRLRTVEVYGTEPVQSCETEHER